VLAGPSNRESKEVVTPDPKTFVWGPAVAQQYIKSNQIKSNQIKSNQIKSNQIKSNQIKSNQIKSNHLFSQANTKVLTK